MTTNEPDRLGRLELIVESNSRAIQALTSAIADNSRAIADTNNAVAATRASVDGLVQIIAEYSARTEPLVKQLRAIVNQLSGKVEHS